MLATLPSDVRTQQIAELRQKLEFWERRSQPDCGKIVGTGCAGLDHLLPSHGVRQGTLIEWVSDAGGVGTLSLLAGRALCQADRPAVLIDLEQHLYPVALSALGFDLSTLIFVHPKTEREALWAYEQSLRSQAVSLVWAKIERLNNLDFRRLQLAAETSGGIGFLVRPLAARRQPSWAEARLQVTPQPSRDKSSRFCIDVIYSRGQTARSTANVEIDPQGALHEVAAESKTYRRRVVS